jgi:phospholipid/cholesterol/gamma-HCH transport system substrate-binding protein
MDTSVRCDEAPPVNPRGAQNLYPPYNSENPGGPAEAGGTGESQNEQDSTALASLPAGGVLGGATEGAPPVIIPGLTGSP